MAARRVQFSTTPPAGTGSARAAWQFVHRQPNWIARTAAMVLAAVILIPILFVLLMAMLAAAVVFLVLSGLNSIGRLFSGEARRMANGDLDRDGRRNVRVIRRDGE